jgi:hypothetical protein
VRVPGYDDSSLEQRTRKAMTHFFQLLFYFYELRKLEICHIYLLCRGCCRCRGRGHRGALLRCFVGKKYLTSPFGLACLFSRSRFPPARSPRWQQDMLRIHHRTSVRSPLSAHGIQQCRLIILFAVAIFHASFHPTRGNILDWSLKAADGIPSHYTIASKCAKPTHRTA